MNEEIEIWCSKCKGIRHFHLKYESGNQQLQVYECLTCGKFETFRGKNRFKRRDLQAEWDKEDKEL